MKRKKSIILPSVIPVRFPAGEELAAAMRALPVMRLARALAGWVGDEQIPIADGWQAPGTKLDAARALGLVAEDGTLTDEITRRLNWIYEIAFHAGHLHTEHGAVHRHHGLDTTTERTDAQIRTAWDGALNALFAHGVEDTVSPADLRRCVAWNQAQPSALLPNSALNVKTSPVLTWPYSLLAIRLSSLRGASGG